MCIRDRSGLGLPISRTIVEEHGGRIWAESELGQGSTLYFALPRAGAMRALERREEVADE
jgi:signal transduction histidine kinase